jgi:hypothetical protein
MKMTVFWDVSPCSLVERLKDGGSKHLWNAGKLYQTTRRNIPQDSHLRSVQLFQFQIEV